MSFYIILGYMKVMSLYKTPGLIGFFVSLQPLEGNLVLKYWKNMRRRLTIVLNVLIMANNFVGLK